MARSQPITWRNVSVDNGASAAAFGNSAANFGRTALQGFDILNTQLQDRINREDTLLTNEAISAALSGGPKISDNRRVDAITLQQAVESDELGNRQERALDDSLLTSAVDRRLNTARAGVEEKELANFDARFALDQKIADAEIAYKRTQSDIEKQKLDILLEERAQKKKDEAAFAAINQELFSPQKQQQAAAEFEQDWAQNAPEGATAADKALARQNYLETAQQEVFNNPRVIQELALKYGTTPLKVYEGTAVGKRALAAQTAADEAIAAQAALRDEKQQTVLSNAQKFSAGNTEFVRFDGEDYVWEKDTNASAATFTAAFQDAGVDPKSDRAKGLKAKIESTFKSHSVAQQLIKEIVRDGEIPSNYSTLVDDRAAQLKQRAIDAQTATEYTGSGDRRVDLQNFYDAISKRTSRDTTAAEAATALSTAPIVAASAIAQINVNPKTTTERDEAKNALELSVQGLLQARQGFKLPQDASFSLRQLYKEFQYQVDVANGQPYLPNQPASVALSVDKAGRAANPKFGTRKEFAVQAATTLQRLQQQIESERKKAEADKLRESLDQ